MDSGGPCFPVDLAHGGTIDGQEPLHLSRFSSCRSSRAESPCFPGRSERSPYQIAKVGLADLPKILPPSETSYLQTLSALEPKLSSIFGAVGQDDGLPAILHCVIGRDRAGIAMALVLLALGAPSDQVVSDFVHNQDAQVLPDVQPEWLEAVVERVDAQGGVEAYLQLHGVLAEQIATLKQGALE